jgi:hypothetical protein
MNKTSEARRNYMQAKYRDNSEYRKKLKERQSTPEFKFDRRVYMNNYRETSIKYKERLQSPEYKLAQKIAKHNRRQTPEHKAHQRKLYQELKAIVFHHYGNKCSCCGETIYDFLNIDHIGGIKTKRTHGIYGLRQIIKNNFPKDLRLLCYNCNCAIGFFGKCPHHNKIDREYRSKNRKIKIFNHYGNKCSCCGETIYEFLSIDHINGGGTKHRKVMRNSRQLYQWIIDNNYPEDLRILCYNCNCGRKSGPCPHEKLVGV